MDPTYFISRHWFGERVSILTIHLLTWCSHPIYKLQINQYYDGGTLRGIPIYWPAMDSYLFFLSLMQGIVFRTFSSRAVSSYYWYAPPQDFISSGICSNLPQISPYVQTSCRHLRSTSTRISVNTSSKLGSCRAERNLKDAIQFADQLEVNIWTGAWYNITFTLLRSCHCLSSLSNL